jgi:hypothetical protein
MNAGEGLKYLQEVGVVLVYALMNKAWVSKG